MGEPCPVCKYHEGVRERIEANNREANLRWEALEKSILVAKSEMDNRLSVMQSSGFISRKELETVLEPMKERINIKQGSDVWVHYLIMIVVSVFLSIILNKIVK